MTAGHSEGDVRPVLADDLPERLRRFREDEWPEIPTTTRGMADRGRLVRDRRRQAWHLARCAWAVERDLDVGDLPDETTGSARRG